MIMKIISLIKRSLEGAISPMVYIMTCVSIVFGFGYTFLTSAADIRNSLLFKYGVLLNFNSINLWAILLMVGAIVTFVGLIYKKRWMMVPGSMLCFLMWAFASITYLANGFYFVFLVLPLFHMLFYGYVYLAASLGNIMRTSTAP